MQIVLHTLLTPSLGDRAAGDSFTTLPSGHPLVGCSSILLLMPTVDKHDGAKLAKEEVARVISNLVKFLPLIHHCFHSLPVEVHLLACVLALYFWLTSKDEKRRASSGVDG